VFKQDTKNLVILEFAEEVNAYLDWRKTEKFHAGESCILALEPEAQVALDRGKLPYTNSIPFFGREGHESVLLSSERIMGFFREVLTIQDDFGVKEGYCDTFLFRFRFFLHHLLFLTEVIYRAVGQLSPETVITAKHSVPPRRSPKLSRSERHVGDIAYRFCEIHELKHVLLPNAHRHETLGLKPFIFGLMRTIAQSLLFPLGLAFYSRRVRGKSPILAHDQSYKMSRLMGRFREAYQDAVPVYLGSYSLRRDVRNIIKDKKIWNFISLPSFVPPEKRRSFGDVLEQNMDRLIRRADREPDMLSHRGVDLRDLLFSFSRDVLLPELMNLYGRTRSLDRIFCTASPSLVVSQHSRELTYNLGEISRESGIPAILISHGSHTPQHDRFAAIEWREHGLGLMNTHYEYLAVQTPWAQAYLDENPTRSILLKTGPLLFATRYAGTTDKARMRRHVLPTVRDKNIILHASTPKTRRSLRFYVYETMDEYIESINALIRAVEGLADTHLVVRFRPADNLSTEELSALLLPSKCYSIHSEGAFEDFLMTADLLISYSSTTIEEALQNRIPVLQYDPHGKYCHVPALTLAPAMEPRPAACYFVGSEENLAWALFWIIQNHLSRNGLAESAWSPHTFSDDEVEDVVAYFGNLFKV